MPPLDSRRERQFLEKKKIFNTYCLPLKSTFYTCHYCSFSCFCSFSCSCSFSYSCRTSPTATKLVELMQGGNKHANSCSWFLIELLNGPPKLPLEVAFISFSFCLSTHPHAYLLQRQKILLHFGRPHKYLNTGNTCAKSTS